MEAEFAKSQIVRSSKSIIQTATGRLSLSEGEGEGEGSFTTRSERSRLNPSPQSSPLAARGEADGSTNCMLASQKRYPARTP